MAALLTWLIGAADLQIGDLARLAYGAGAEQAADRLHELLDWRVQRAMTIVKGTIGTSIAFAVVLVAAQFNSELRGPAAFVCVAIVFALLIASFGVYTLRRLANVGAQYSQLLTLLRLLS